MKTAPKTFSKTQIYLHWIVVVLVAFQFLFGDGISKLWKDRMDGLIPNEPSINPHAIVGILILVLVAWRLWLRFSHGVPALPESKSAIAGMISKTTHILFYVLLIGMPFSGAGAWFLGFEQPAFTHIIAGNILIALIALHLAAALLHHFVLKTDVLKRMVGKG